MGALSTVYEVVQRLLMDEFEAIESAVREGRENWLLKSLDERGVAQELIRQQYTGRYPFELLQNANDAAAKGREEVGITGLTSVRFVLTETSLIVANMGSPFGEAEIRAICGLGRTSKDPRKSIGYKGIGFKAVGEISESAQILSDGVRFQFNAGRVREEVFRRVGRLSDEQHLPVYAFPFPVDEPDLASDADTVRTCFDEGYVTVLRLPLKQGVDSDKVEDDLLRTLTPRTLLLLDATERLEVRGTSRDFTATRAVEERDGYVEALLELSDGKLEQWLVFRRSMPIEDVNLTKPLGRSWSEVTEVGIAAAFPLNEAGQPDPGDAVPLHVYFQSEEITGFSFIVHGDFVLDLDRRHVSESPEAIAYNTWLLENFSRYLAAEIGPRLSRLYPESRSPVAALAPQARGTGFGARLQETCLDELRNSPFVPVVSGSYLAPSQAKLLPDDLTDSGSAHHFADLTEHANLALASVEADKRARRFLRSSFNCEPILLREVLTRIRRPSTSDEYRELYEWLVGWAENQGSLKFARALSDVACLLTQADRWCSPSERVFFPRERDAPDLPEELPIEIVVVPDVEGARELMEAAGVRSFQWRALVLESILPILTDTDAEESLRAKAHEGLRTYFETQGRGDREILSRVGSVLLPARDLSGRERQLRDAQRMYFSKDWLGTNGLEQIYGSFGEVEFLDWAPPEDSDDRQRLASYFHALGVSNHPRLDAIEDSNYPIPRAPGHPHRRYGQFWQKWLNSDEVQSTVLCGQHHPESQLLRSSYALDRFPELVESHDPTKMRSLYEELASNWSSYEVATKSIVHCRHSQHAGNRDRALSSFFMSMLTTADWIPSVVRGEVRLLPPTKVWRAATKFLAR